MLFDETKAGPHLCFWPQSTQDSITKWEDNGDKLGNSLYQTLATNACGYPYLGKNNRFDVRK